MLDVFNFPSPQQSNYQEFYGGGSTRDWVKPRGASMVRMLLIGAGGGGSGGGVATTNGCNGGGSGAVTEWIGPAIFIPDILRVSLGAGGTGGAGSTTNTINAGTAGGATSVVYQQKDGTGYTLLTANGGNAGGAAAGSAAGGAAFANNYFGASGIFSSIAGQTSQRDSNITASDTIFLSAGSGGGQATTAAGYQIAVNYNYPSLSGGAGTTGGNGANGYFITAPIMLGSGGSGGGGNSTTAGGSGGRGGTGCGGGGGGRGTTTGGAGGRGGDGAVFIWSW